MLPTTGQIPPPKKKKKNTNRYHPCPLALGRCHSANTVCTCMQAASNWRSMKNNQIIHRSLFSEWSGGSSKLNSMCTCYPVGRRTPGTEQRSGSVETYQHAAKFAGPNWVTTITSLIIYTIAQVGEGTLLRVLLPRSYYPVLFIMNLYMKYKRSCMHTLDKCIRCFRRIVVFLRKHCIHLPGLFKIHLYFIVWQITSDSKTNCEQTLNIEQHFFSRPLSVLLLLSFCLLYLSSVESSHCAAYIK